MRRILIKNGRVWDGEHFFYSDILCENGRVLTIAPSISDAADAVFDAEGKIVSAGFVDAHLHMKGISSNVYGASAPLITAPFGVTAAADAGSEQGDERLVDVIMPKSCVFPLTRIENNSVDRDWLERLIKLFGNRVAGVKIAYDLANPQIRDITPLKELCSFARSRGLRVLVHSTGSPTSMASIVSELSSGDVITHVYHGGKNTIEENGFEAYKIAKSRGVILDAGLAGHVHTDFGIFKRAVEKGFLPEIISTDITSLSAYVRGGIYGMTMCMSIARTLGMSESDIFRAITSSPAEALGYGGVWGCLKEGSAADIAIIDYGEEKFSLTDNAGNTVSDTKSYKCIMTLLDGHVIYRGALL